MKYLEKMTVFTAFIAVIWFFAVSCEDSVSEPEHSCSFGEWSVMASADCIKAAEFERNCFSCGKKEMQGMGSPLGHEWNLTAGDEPPTCTASGFGSGTCERCDESVSNSEIPALGHNLPISWTTETPATCTVAGSEKKTCQRNCGHFITQPIPAIGHNLSTTWTVQTAASCTTGLEKKDCQRGCGHYITQVIPAIGHDWSGSWTTTGKVTKTCTASSCNSTLSVSDEMVQIPAGTFLMGNDVFYNPWEYPVRSVTLSAFKMGKYEVTRELYQAVMGTSQVYNDTPTAGETQSKRPVYGTWFNAIEFCNKLSEREGLTPVYTITGIIRGTESWNENLIISARVIENWGNNGYRLPTDAEWEYACRAGSTSYWYFGNTESQLVNYAWYDANSNGESHEVGKKLPNAFGLYDMHGNEGEWCWDWFDYYQPGAQTNNPRGPDSAPGDVRTVRNASYNYDSGSLRSSYRHGGIPGFEGNGFRVVRR